MSQLPALAQWGGLGLIVIGGWLADPALGIAASGVALLLLGILNEAPE
jgi:hypothetical protein